MAIAAVIDAYVMER